ncbi:MULTISPECIES: hypothetical protein [Burkholderia]|uniref:hypothetical protein n=1 Tax=Burkholderia TaxID=32008 RepID=UPI0005081E5F|nr:MULTISPECIES: hypothetical protein [Burkholderia]EKS9886296.1 hypothetical protein [Burkholderia pyrrocinia]EKS9896774.1 hypothetical protein [Burkholderia pyrrocinia]EKS9909454.1 hypothetical protein [Burkholderia pyrrocinia]KFL53093.1 hypothetical protein JM78_13285 [Burkholderia pyrrocinia]TDA43895.1 hypothetical protein EVG18_30225 [Burkholderia pyrrocinia]
MSNEKFSEMQKLAEKADGWKRVDVESIQLGYFDKQNTLPFMLNNEGANSFAVDATNTALLIQIGGALTALGQKKKVVAYLGNLNHGGTLEMLLVDLK